MTGIKNKLPIITRRSSRHICSWKKQSGAMKEKKSSLEEMTFEELVLELELETLRCYTPINNSYLEEIKKELVKRYENR